VEEKKNEEKDKDMMMIMALFVPISSTLQDYKIWPNFASMIKFQPSIAFCVFLYSFFHSGSIYMVYDPDIILVLFCTIMFFSPMVFTIFLITSKIRNGVQYTAPSKPRGIQVTKHSVAK
jgi:hypothetical protein